MNPYRNEEPRKTFADEIRELQMKPMTMAEMDALRIRIRSEAEKDEHTRKIILRNLRPSAQAWLRSEGFTLNAMSTVGEFIVSW